MSSNQENITPNHQNSHEKDALPSKEVFLKRYKISSETFNKANISWIELEKIYNDYVTSHRKLLESVLKDITDSFLTDDAKEVGVHSVRSRMKKPDSLIEKIIRKKYSDFKKKKPERTITTKTYWKEIHDLIGIRVLHVFKDEWFPIHDFIINQCGYKTNETPIAYYRKGDSKEFINDCKKNGCETRVHPKAYRSIHYIIDRHPEKNIGFAEIQVRTIFEEGWSEIDHKLSYKKKGSKNVLDKYLLALNRIAGSADEVGLIIKNRSIELRKAETEKELNKKKNKK